MSSIERVSCAICGDVAESAFCFALGGVARQTFALHQVFDAPLDVEAQLGVELGAETVFRGGQAEDAAHGTPAVVDPGHLATPAALRALRTRPTTLVYRDQRVSSAVRCFRPAAVRR